MSTRPSGSLQRFWKDLRILFHRMTAQRRLRPLDGEPSVRFGPRSDIFFDRVRATSPLPPCCPERESSASRSTDYAVRRFQLDRPDPTRLNQAARAARGAGAPRALTRA